MQVLLDDGRAIFAQVADDFVVDMDKPWHALEANSRMVDHLCAQIDESIIADGAEISDGADISGNIVVGENTRIGKRVVLRGGAVIG
ncbi:MAG TPA: nucleotidyl transferase, partial [Bacteroidetes bacterium]|nr:nucleotidyl transferase [Bacteroidota bacterium]